MQSMANTPFLAKRECFTMENRVRILGVFIIFRTNARYIEKVEGGSMTEKQRLVLIVITAAFAILLMIATHVYDTVQALSWRLSVIEGRQKKIERSFDFDYDGGK